MKRVAKIVLWCVLVLIVAPSLMSAAISYARGWPSGWSTADWSSAHLLPAPEAEAGARVLIMSARTGRWKGVFVEHCWIVLKERNGHAWRRYDVVGWGNPVRRDAFAADGFWYGNRPSIVFSASGREAERLIPLIEAAISRYPWSKPGTYAVWPGPNSNSFVAWTVRQTPGLEVELPPTAVGKDFLGRGFALSRTPSGTGWQASWNGLIGLGLARDEGIELHLLGATLGLDLLKPAIKLPALGRIGVNGVGSM